ncbi:hypothetical protein N7474_005943 [Penicillium riverlandense]|uniref:uncharacterized protein n=1 Tax=Penicillium riverlandense TaxID=1903569 RepID=UPI00254928DC|nr:uncharacterized protein N7474_005943 [Penicillium riverlandense]KAJ5820352.1 hypothetical protein N7474_005943 [Penicillium riverlandense]
MMLSTSRRRTRSQSRELESHGHVANEPVSSASQQAQVRGKSTASRLSMVTEETPGSSRKTPSSNTRYSVVPESPGMHEGHTNISGSTILPLDSQDNEPEPILMVDELPDLQRAATNVMDLLVPRAAKPISIVNAAAESLKDDAATTQGKRVSRAVGKLESQDKVFPRQTYIDTDRISRLLPSVSIPGAAQPWTPLPMLYKANCAWLARDVLYATVGKQSQMQVVRNLEGQFPAPFLNKVVAGSQSRPLGASATDKDTFDLALQIRTLLFVMELEKRQYEKNFQPLSLLKGVFYDELALEGEDSQLDPSSFRGFNLPGIYQDQNGCLPERFQEAVEERFSELEDGLFDDEGLPNIRELKAAYPWKRFVLQVIRWIIKRDGEIREDLQALPAVDDVRETLERGFQDQIRPRAFTTPSRLSESVAPERGPRNSVGQQSQATSNGQRVITESPIVSRDFGRAASPVFREFVRQESPKRPTVEPVDRRRRKSSKTSRLEKLFLNRDTYDDMERRAQAHQRKELSTLKSQPAAPSSTANSRLTDSFHYSEETLSYRRAEIPQSPEPPANQQYRDGDVDEVDLTGRQQHEIMESNSPPGSARINQVSHPSVSGRFFDSPQAAPPQRVAGPSNDEVLRLMNEPTPAPGPSSRAAFIDRQSNAERVSPISHDTDVWSSERRHGQVESPATRKRPRQESSSSDEDSNDDLGQDDRQINTAERRAQKPPQRSHLAEKRPRFSTESDAANIQLQQSLDVSSHASQPTAPQPVGSHSAASRPAGPSRIAALQMAQSEASNPPAAPTGPWATSVFIPRSDQDGRLGPKRTYSQEEDERLIFLIGKYGKHWSVIEKEDSFCPVDEGGPKLKGRNQVSLKDRARNLRAMFDREGRPLPKNFDQIAPAKRR